MITQNKEPEIQLIESTHTYIHKSGRELLSVTEAFAKIGITDFSRVPFDVIEPARLRGQLVHEIAMLYGLGVLDESTVDPALSGYLDAIKAFYQDEVGEVIALEQPVFSLTCGCAGTPDLIYRDRSHVLRCDDFKTPIKPHKAAKWQTGAYAFLWQKMNKGQYVEKRRSVHFRPDGTYFFDEHNNPLRRDWNNFLIILGAAILKISEKIN